MTTRLVLATGSRAGMEAPLQTGYYMIGRSRECQIRPKTHSVSRRHCLIEHVQDRLRVRDLCSSAGTRINERKLEPHVWESLEHGDLLRCGKMVFSVQIQGHEEIGVPADGSASMVSGEAWPELEVADLLTTQDDADRQQRYQAIRGRNADADSDEVISVADDVDQSDADQDDAIEDDVDPDIETQVDLFDVDDDAFDQDLFDDSAGFAPAPPQSPSATRPAAPLAPQPAAVTASQPAATATVESPVVEGEPDDVTQPDDDHVGPDGEDVEETSKKSKKKRRKSKRSLTARIPKARGPKAARSRPSLQLPQNLDQVKLLAASVLLVGVLGALGFSVYRFMSGPDVRVLQNID